MIKLNSELETLSQDKLKREKELKDKIKDTEKGYTFLNQKLTAEAEGLKADLLNISFQLEKILIENQLLKDELEATKTKLTTSRKKLKEVQTEYSKNKSEGVTMNCTGLIKTVRKLNFNKHLIRELKRLMS